jgi:hypothetical protein
MFGRALRGFDTLLPPPVALVLASVGATVSAIVVASTLIANGPLIAAWTVVPLFLGIFPIHVRSVRLLLPDRDLKKRLLAAPRLLLVGAGLAGAITFPLVMHGVFTLGGQPERHANRYYVDNHGDSRRVSRSEYRYSERLEERIFAGAALVFYLVGVLVNAGESKLNASAGTPGRPSTSPGPASAR